MNRRDRSRRRVVLYSDAAVFGGHEVMACYAIEAMLDAGWDCIVVAYHGNHKFLAALQRFTSRGLTIQTTNIRYRTATSFAPLLQPGGVARLVRIFAALRPDVLLLLQGHISNAAPALLAAWATGTETLSYIPCAHPAALTARSRTAGLVRDWSNRSRYQAIGRFITCYEGAARDIHRWAPRARVEVVMNVCPQPTQPAQSRAATRAALGVGEANQVVALVGRVEFRQKRQDFVVEHLEELFRDNERAVLLIVGDGPDLEALRALIAASSLAQRIVTTGWRNDVGDILYACDVLLLPSKFEGMPLVMLEAITLGLPVIASAVDGMRDVLPPEWLFSPGSAPEMRAALARALAPGGEHSARLRELSGTMSQAVFAREFVRAVETLLSQD